MGMGSLRPADFRRKLLMRSVCVYCGSNMWSRPVYAERAAALGEPAGFVKVIAHAETDRVLGLHLVGVGVSELVHEGVLTMEFNGSADDLARICHAHPTLSEAIHDAAMAVDKRAIHKAN